MHSNEPESVYESFYKFSDKPFRLSPDPQFFYPSAGHKRALSYLLYGLNQGEGFVVITGAPGTGKTTLAHKLLLQVDPQSVVVAHLASTQIEAEDLLRLVAASFKLRSENVSKASLLKDIESFLLARARERKRCLLVVDEAQNLPPRSIEELRMLSNFQVGNKALMQVFLLGQEQFRVMLNSADFEQLRQRVIADYHLHPLDAEETRRYVEARLQHVGWQNDPQFDAGAHAMIFEYTGGLPRRINMFCDRLLLFGYLEGLHALTHATVCSVITELHNEILPRSNNIVFTPAEPSVEPVAPTETRVSDATDRPTSPPPPLPAAPRTAQPAMEGKGAEPTKSNTPPAAATQRQAPPAEPTPAETPNAAAVRNIFATNPLREARDPAMADFLLAEPEPRLNPRGDPRRALSNAMLSLAGAESRWLLMILGACVLLLMLTFLFYPSLQDALQRMQPPQVESRAPLSTEITGSSAGLAQQITDPSENVLTEKRILASPSPAISENVITDKPERLLHTSNEPVATPALEKKFPAVSVADDKAPQAVSPSQKTPALEQRSPVQSTPGTMPVAKSAAAAASPDATSTPATTAPIPASASIAPIETGAPVNAISQRELALLVVKFTRYYEEGNLPLFLSLFDPQVRTEDSNSVDAIQNDYSDLFKKTALRKIHFGEIHWENAGRLAQGTGAFEVQISPAEGEPARALLGEITFHIEKKNSAIVITALYHTLH